MWAAHPRCGDQREHDSKGQGGGDGVWRAPAPSYIPACPTDLYLRPNTRLLSFSAMASTRIPAYPPRLHHHPRSISNLPQDANVFSGWAIGRFVRLRRYLVDGFASRDGLTLGDCRCPSDC